MKGAPLHASGKFSDDKMTAATLAEAWRAHAGACRQCSDVSLARPATLAQACLTGSRLFKDMAAAAHRELNAATEQRRSAKRGADEMRGELSLEEQRLVRGS